MTFQPPPRHEPIDARVDSYRRRYAEPDHDHDQLVADALVHLEAGVEGPAAQP